MRTATRRQADDPTLGAKVAFLRNPRSYPETTGRVDTVETHMSWVFLTDRNAWKLKKPVRHSYLDFSTVAARRFYWGEVVRLYQSYRACMRAKIAIWHQKEPALADPSKWTAQARDDLRLAAEHVAHCGS